MRFATPDDFTRLFGASGFAVTSWPRADWHTQLRLGGPQQAMFGCQPPPSVSSATAFIRATNRWFRSEWMRLLWINQWEDGATGSLKHLVEAARRGDGAGTTLHEAPGLLFDAHPYHKEDQTEISTSHSHELGLLAGYALLMIASGSYGWLMAEGERDRIEFWEGNLIFYSDQPAQLARARALAESFDCPARLL